MDVFETSVVKLESIDTPVRLHATGDWHVGEAGCSESKLRRAIEAIEKDDHSLVLLMGDLGGFIAPDDRRWDPASVADGLGIEDLEDWGWILTERIAAIAKPIRKKVIGSLQGNHEQAYSRRNHVKVHHHLAKEIGCKSLGYAALFKIHFKAPDGESVLSVMATHGSGGGATPGGKMNRLIRIMQSVDSDLVLMGHVHACLSYEQSMLRQEGNEIAERQQLGVITGTYLRTYCQGHSGYGERAGYHPTRIGHPVIEIVPRTKAMSVGWV